MMDAATSSSQPNGGKPVGVFGNGVAGMLGKVSMREDQARFLALGRQPPARLTVRTSGLRNKSVESDAAATITGRRKNRSGNYSRQGELEWGHGRFDGKREWRAGFHERKAIADEIANQPPDFGQLEGKRSPPVYQPLFRLGFGRQPLVMGVNHGRGLLPACAAVKFSLLCRAKW
jgi:hypothetical protein